MSNLSGRARDSQGLRGAPGPPGGQARQRGGRPGPGSAGRPRAERPPVHGAGRPHLRRTGLAARAGAPVRAAPGADRAGGGRGRPPPLGRPAHARRARAARARGRARPLDRGCAVRRPRPGRPRAVRRRHARRARPRPGRHVNVDALWHDLECGDYREDLPLWRSLAAGAGGTVLDVGAGTGRVTLDLAARGIPVVALDIEPALLAALAHRAGSLPVETVVADARRFALPRRFALVLAPMQTLQLLGGAEGRAAFLAAARAHLLPGGMLAAAIAHPLEPFEAETAGAPDPDLGEADGLQLVSRPVAIRDEGDR